MALEKLKDLTIKKAKPKEKDYTLPDGGGLQLLIKTSGSKLWEFYYQSPTTLKRRKTSFGTYPQTTLIQAREKSREYKELIFKGIDAIDYFKNIHTKTKLENEGLFSKVVDGWLAIKKQELTPKTYIKVEGLFNNYVKPFFKDKNIADIKHPEIAKIIQLKALQASDTANKLHQYLNRVWIYAISKGYCEYNMVANIDKRSIIPKISQKSYSKIVEKEQLQELIKAIYKYNGNYSTRNALRFVLHIPLRASNLINLQWKQINFEDRTLTIPRKEMKDKNKNFDDFVMPLSDEVINILQEQKDYLNSNIEYVFAVSSYQNTPINPETPNKALQRMGFNDESRGRKQRLHSFRGTFRSLVDTHDKEHNASFETKEIALDHHNRNSVVRAYNNKANHLEQLKPLMKWWSGFIVKMLDEVA